MSIQFLTYDAIAVAAWLIALALIKPRNLIDLSRCVGWYILVFFATYILRPSLSEIVGDLELYQWLKIGSFEDHWHLMAIAVPLAIISFGIAYAAAGPSRARMRGRSATQDRFDPHKVRVLIVILIGLGYFALAVGWKTGGMSGDVADYAGASMGVYEHNTAWFAQDDLFVSTGSILYYILSGSLGMSLMMAAPWMMVRVVYGWGRSHLLGHLFSLVAVYFLRARMRRSSGRMKLRQVVVICLAIVVALVLFPLMGMLRSVKASLHLNASSVSKDVLGMVEADADPVDMLQTYMGTNSSVAGFEQTLNHLLHDQRSEMGVSYLYFYLFKPIPRIIWPGKGDPYTWAERLRGVEFDPLMSLIGAAPGSIGMAFQEWGWLGIPFEFLLTGLIMRKSEEAARRRPYALHLQLGYVGLYGMLPQLGRDSLLYMISSFWLFQFGIPVFVLWRMNKGAIERTRSHAAALSAVAARAVTSPG